MATVSSDPIISDENAAPGTLTAAHCSDMKREDLDIVRQGLQEEIAKCVVRQKLAKRRHLVLQSAFSSEYLDSLFPSLLKLFNPQKVMYNGGIANIKEWKIR